MVQPAHLDYKSPSNFALPQLIHRFVEVSKIDHFNLCRDLIQFEAAQSLEDVFLRAGLRRSED
ncbi:hypothetical protein APSETT445_003832 [Aspergillus pseudonomiae]